MFRSRAIFFWLVLGFHGSALAETVPLARYLERGRADGINILYSSDLVPSTFRVTFDPAQPVTVEKIRRILERFDLKLEPAGANTFTVIRPDSIPTAEVPQKQLAVAPPALEELVVSSSRYRLLMRESLRSTLLTQDELRDAPAVGNDPVRLAARLPGNSSNGLSARPRFRGGAEDETLILFDGVRIYEPFHFNNFNNLISTFDSRLVDTLEFHGGGFPVDKGDRMSAVMDVTSRSNEPGRRELGFGLFNLSYLQEEQDWMIAARRSTLDWFTGFIESDPGSPSFADLFARYERYSDGGLRSSYNVLWFGDDMDLSRDGGNEIASSINGSTYLWFDRESAWGEAITGKTWLGFTAIKDDRQARVDQPGIVSGTLDDSREFRVYHIKHDATLLPGSPDWLVRAGIEYRYMEAEFDVDLRRSVDPAFAALAPRVIDSIDVAKTELGHQAALWALTRVRLLPAVTVELGLRYDAQHYEGDITEAQSSPRVNILFAPGPDFELRLGWGRFAQAEGLHELKIADGLTAYQLPQRASHVNVGMHKAFDNGLDIRLEAYRKHGLSTATYFENLTSPLTFAPELQPDRVAVSPDSFEAKGIELSVAGQFRTADWWLNYSYSSARDYFGAQTIRRSWDNKHSGNAGLSLMIWKWRTAVSVGYHSGWSTTPLIEENDLIVPTTRNIERFGNYVSVDAKFTRAWQLGKDELRVEVGLTNLFNRDNIIGFEYEKTATGLQRSPQTGLSLLPIVDVYYRF